MSCAAYTICPQVGSTECTLFCLRHEEKPYLKTPSLLTTAVVPYTRPAPDQANQHPSMAEGGVSTSAWLREGSQGPASS